MVAVRLPHPRALALAALAAVAAAQNPPEAGWREEAAARIERLRKAAVQVRVTDAAGNPVPGARVNVRMKRHAFGFGSAVAASYLLGEGPEQERYRAKVLELFNKAVLENDLKWPQWEAARERALGALAWLGGHGIPVRGHNLVWPGWKHLPRDVEELASGPAALRARIGSHIAEEAGAVRGKVAEWDVINEPYNNRVLQNLLGDEAMAGWFRKAREADPSAILYINDFGILSNGGGDAAHQDHYYKTIEFLDRQGAPVQGIGMQGHFNRNLTPPARVIEILDRFATLGKRIQITEFDIDIDDEGLQADYTRDFMTAVFSHPSVDGFLMWGFWEGRHWRPRGAMFRRDWSAKPNAEVYRKLVFEDWWTRSEGTTDSGGAYSTRGFLGWYEATAAAGGRTGKAGFVLGRPGAEVNIRLPAGP